MSGRARGAIGLGSLALLCGALLALAIATPARSEVIPVRQMAQGMQSTPAQCRSHAYAVWVTVSGRGYCIRYYVSTAGGEGRMPIVWLSGDKIGRIDLKTRRFTIKPEAEDVKTENLQQQADNLSRQAKTTAIYLARPGLDGSSGHHGYRRSWLELYVLQAAMEAIKQRHGFSGFHLAGQSGGGGLVVGLLSLRQDIGCAVPGAGSLSIRRRPRQEQDPLLEFFDPLLGVQKIARLLSTRIIVVTDPNDQTVPMRMQAAFVQAVRQAGGRVEQFMVEATDEHHHAVAVYTRFVVAGCVRGMDYQQIAAGVARLQERHVAAARERKQRHAGGPTPAYPGRPAGPVPAPAPRMAPSQPVPPRSQPPQPPRYQPAQAPRLQPPQNPPRMQPAQNPPRIQPAQNPPRIQPAQTPPRIQPVQYPPRVQPAQAPRLQPHQPALVPRGIMKGTPRVASHAPQPAPRHFN